MFIKALRSQFYDVLVRRAQVCRRACCIYLRHAQHVLIVCAIDVDAVCACALLRCCLRADDLSHTLCMARGPDDLRVALRTAANSTSHVVLINCGAQMNLHAVGDECGVPDETRYYVIDR
jgi:hypothetical protein